MNVRRTSLAAKSTLLLGGLLAQLAPLGEARAQGAGAEQGPVYIPNQYIVMFKDAVDNPGLATAQLARQHGLAVGHLYSDAVKGFSGVIPPGRLRAILNDPRVESVERDQVVFATNLPTGINRVEADLSGTAKIDGFDERVDVDIAILDTGIDPNHNDLNVGGGVNYTSESSWADGNGHGTHVAGTAAALDNGVGVVGVAPGARLWAVKVLGSNGSGSLSAIISGVDWVTSNAATIEVANMSLGFKGTSSTLDRALSRSASKGVVYAVAAGNSAADASGYSPAKHTDVLCVSAIADSDGLSGGLGAATWAGADDTFASFSNYGSVVDIAAPGVEIVSTFPGGGYATASGTSMASPHAAGAAALYMANRSRDVNGDGRVDKNDSLAVRKALISAGTPQSSLDGFKGDKDTSAEPLLNASGF